MIGKFVSFIMAISLFGKSAHSFLLKANARKSFAFKGYAKLEGRQVLGENELALAMRPPWLKGMDNRFHNREAFDELAFARRKLPASNEEKAQLLASMVKDWTMPCYELSPNNVPVPVATTDKFDVNVKKSWTMDLMRQIETVFLGYDQRFGRHDQGDKPKVFETVVRSSGESGYCTSRTFHAATYEDALRTHDEVHRQAELGAIEFFPHCVEVE